MNSCRGKTLYFAGKCRRISELLKLVDNKADQDNVTFRGTQDKSIKSQEETLVITEELGKFKTRRVVLKPVALTKKRPKNLKLQKLRKARRGRSSSRQSSSRNGNSENLKIPKRGIHPIVLQTERTYDRIHIAGAGHYLQKTIEIFLPNTTTGKMEVKYWEKKIFLGPGSYQIYNSAGYSMQALAQDGGEGCGQPESLKRACDESMEKIIAELEQDCLNEHLPDFGDYVVLGASFSLIALANTAALMSVLSTGGMTAGGAVTFLHWSFRAIKMSYGFQKIQAQRLCDADTEGNLILDQLAKAAAEDEDCLRLKNFCPPKDMSADPDDPDSFGNCPEGTLLQPTRVTDSGYCDPDRMNCTCPSDTGTGGPASASSNINPGTVNSEEGDGESGVMEIIVTGSSGCYTEFERSEMQCARID